MAVARRIVEDFGAHRPEDYFGSFASDATFIFPGQARVLQSRAEYEAEWVRWEREHGFHVGSCHSSAARLQMLGATAVFTHDVDTEVEWDGALVANRERETIVLAERAGRWLCVHEHLSTRA
jgi:ketosteroid isomerase-like protein